MAEAESGFKWWIRYVLVPLIGGGGIITLLVTLLGRSPSPPLRGAQPPDVVSPSMQVAQPQDVVTHWWDALGSKSMEEALSLSGLPFYFGKTIVFTQSDLRETYERAFKGEEPHTFHVVGVAEPESLGKLRETGRHFDFGLPEMHLSSEDLAVDIKVCI